MGLFSWATDFLLGTEGDAQKKNEGLLGEGRAALQGVDLASLFGQARGALTGQGRADIQRNYQQAIAQVGAAGTGAALDAKARGQEMLGGVRRNLGQRGLYGSSLIAPATAGVGDMTSRTLSGIAGQTSAAQGGLLADRGRALADESGRRQAMLASLFSQQAGMELGRANSLAQLLSSYQYQGQPGVLGQLGGQFLGGFGGALGQLGGKLGGNLFGL